MPFGLSQEALMGHPDLPLALSPEACANYSDLLSATSCCQSNDFSTKHPRTLAKVHLAGEGRRGRRRGGGGEYEGVGLDTLGLQAAATVKPASHFTIEPAGGHEGGAVKQFMGFANKLTPG